MTQESLFADPFYDFAVALLIGQIVRGDEIKWQGCSDPGGLACQVGGYAEKSGNLVKIPAGQIAVWDLSRCEFYSIDQMRAGVVKFQDAR